MALAREVAGVYGRSMLTICLLTYNRFEYARTTLESVLKNVVYDGNMAVHIADDGSPSGYIDDLVASMVRNVPVSWSNSERGGYGANYNLAMQTVHNLSRFVLPLEDDWELTRRLDLNRLTRDLLILGGGCIRLGYLGFTQELRGKAVRGEEDVYLRLDANSDEPHVFAGHPRLETTEWARLVGPWPEGLGAGATEFAVSKLPTARQRVFWPMELVKPNGDLFAHIGTHRAIDPVFELEALV